MLSSRRTRLALAGLALAAAGCVGTPGVEGVRGTAPSPSTEWTPPPAPRAAAAPTAPPHVIPANIAARVDSLSLSDVVDIALRNNAQTAATWADARAAAATYGAERGSYFPSLTLSGSVTRLKTVQSQGRTGVDQTVYGPTLNLSYLLFDFGGRTGAVRNARDALLQADWTHNATIQSVVLQVEIAYFQYFATKSLLTAQQSTLAEADTNLKAAQERHDVGLATIADVLQARTARSQARLALETTQGQLASARGALALSMGLPANVPYDIERAPEGPPPLGIMEGVDSLIARAVRTRPDLSTARAVVDAADARVTQARGAMLPSLSLSANAGRTYVANSSIQGANYTASLGISIPLFQGFSRQYQLRAAEASADAARARATQLEQRVTYQVFTAYYGLQTATQRVRTSDDLLASATQSEEVALARYREGVGSVLDLLTAQAALADARAQSIDARWSWYTALAQLAHDTGVLGLDGSTPFHFAPDSTPPSPQ
ncbi:MAG TPA: TolC family protein [Gemmatimonadales bacterium]|nr:TolC family protein [Gemmatimonadales bacterium]